MGYGGQSRRGSAVEGAPPPPAPLKRANTSAAELVKSKQGKKAESDEPTQFSHEALTELQAAVDALKLSSKLNPIAVQQAHSLVDQIRSALPERRSGWIQTYIGQQLCDEPVEDPSQSPAKATLELAQQYSEQADREEARLKEMRLKASLDIQVMTAINEQNLSAMELMTRWFKDGDSKIEAKDFRKHIKALGIPAESKASDELFSQLDNQKKGRLELKDLKPILKKLQAAATAALGEWEIVAKGIKEVRQRAEQTRLVAQEDDEVAKEEKALAYLTDNKPAYTRLAVALEKKKLSVIDFQRQLDDRKTNEGHLTKVEWNAHIEKLALEVDLEQLSTFFDQMDVNKAGSMHMEELRTQMKDFGAKATDIANDLTRRKKELGALRRRAAQSQLAFASAQADELEKARIKEKEKREAAAQASAQEAAEKELKAREVVAAKEKAKAEKEAAKAAFQARVDARRKEEARRCGRPWAQF